MPLRHASRNFSFCQVNLHLIMSCVKKVTPLFLLVYFLVLGVFSAYGGEYLVGPGDVISIVVYDNDDLKAKVRVSSNGTIVVPLLGQSMSTSCLSPP